MKVIIAGGRNFNNYEELCKFCDNALSRQNKVEIVSKFAKVLVINAMRKWLNTQML